jgi:hypothetical protein
LGERDVTTPLPATVLHRRIGRLLLVRDSNGQQLTISRMSRGGDSAAKLLAKDEARRIAANIAKLPDFLKR